MPELICDDCPLKRILKDMGEYAELKTSEEVRNELNELTINFFMILGARALGTECDGPKVIGAVCGLDRYAELNSENYERFTKITTRKQQ